MPPRFPILWFTVLLFALLGVATWDLKFGAFVFACVLPILLLQWLIRWACRRLRISVGLRRGLMLLPILLLATFAFGFTRGANRDPDGRKIAITEDRINALWAAVEEFEQHYFYPTQGTHLAERFDDAAQRSGFTILTPHHARMGPDFIDAWGRPIRLDYDGVDFPPKPESAGLTIRSAGPDGEYLTKDDVWTRSIGEATPGPLTLEGLSEEDDNPYSPNELKYAVTRKRLAAVWASLMAFRSLSPAPPANPPEPGTLLAQNFGFAGEAPALILLPTGSTLYGGEYLDSWERPIRIVIHGEEIAIRSAGPDGKFLTEDDLTHLTEPLTQRTPETEQWMMEWLMEVEDNSLLPE